MLLNASYTIKTFDDATSEEFKFNKGEKIIFKPADDGIGHIIVEEHILQLLHVDGI